MKTTALAYVGTTSACVAWTPYVFMMLETESNTHDWLGWVDTYKDVSLVCVNDDVREGEEEAVSRLFREIGRAHV